MASCALSESGAETMPDEKPALTGTRFVLAVPDVVRTTNWWIGVMGFDPWMEPESWRCVRRGTVVATHQPLRRTFVNRLTDQ